jgi:hypothetical protein
VQDHYEEQGGHLRIDVAAMTVLNAMVWIRFDKPFTGDSPEK